MIRRLRTKNFLALPDLQSPEFGKLNVIIGQNGSGKSSIADALSILFSGTASGCETGRGLESLRTIGGNGKRWQIEALSDTGAKISRNEDEGPLSAKQKQVESLTGVTGAKARACIEAGELARLDLKARQRLLSDLAPKATVSLPPAIRLAVRDLLGEDYAEVEVAAIERLYRAAYEARADVARDVKAIGDLDTPIEPELLSGGDVNPERELVEVRADLATLRKERDLAVERAAPKMPDTKPYADAVAKTTRELEGVQQAIAGLPTKAEIGQLAKDLVAKIENVTETNAAIEAKRADLKGKMGIAEGIMRSAKTALDAVTAQSGEVGCCPVCDSKLTKVNRGKLEVSLKNKCEQAGRDRQRINEELKAMTEPKSTAALDRESDALQAKETRLVGLLVVETRLAARLLEEKAAFTEAQEKPTELGEPIAAAEAMTLADRIGKGEEILEALVAYIAARKAYQTNVDAKAVAMKRHVELDQLVADLGPNGIRKGCANAGMFAFHEDLNKLLKPRGFTIDLRPAMDAEGDPIVTVKGKQVPLSRLSKGERTAFGAAFACAVASVTGLGIVVVDDFDGLDFKAHPAVMEILEGSGHQVFILSAQRDPDDEVEALAAEVNAENGAMRMMILREGQLVAPGIAAAKETAA